MHRSPRSRSPQRRGGNSRNTQGRSPRARLTRGRSPRPRSISRGSPIRMHESSRQRRSPDRQRNGTSRKNLSRGNGRGRGKSTNQRARQQQGANSNWGQQGRKKARRRGRRANNGPNLSGGNRQPVTTMRMRMDDYAHPRGGRASNQIKGNDVGHAVARARKEASTRTKDTFWTKKLLDAESQNGTSRRWVHNGFKELYRDELGYSDLDNRSDGEVPHQKAQYRSREAKFARPKDSNRNTRKKSRSPHRNASPMRPSSPLHGRQSSPGSKKSRVTYSSSPTTSSSFSSRSSYESRSRSVSSFSRSSSSSSGSSFTGSSSSGSSASFRRGRQSFSKSRSKSPRRTKVEPRRPSKMLSKTPTKPKKIVGSAKKNKDFGRSPSVEPVDISSPMKKISPVPALRMSDGEETVSDSSSDEEPEARKMTLSERFGKLAQLSSQRQEYEGVRMKIVREGGQDKKVYMEGLRASRSSSPRKSRGAHEKWLREHKDEYDEYQKCYGEFRHWDPHRDLPRNIPPNWDDVNVRYTYYKESGYFGDRKITMEDYLKWEEWWYRYKHWLEKFDGQERDEWKTYENPPRWSRQSSREKPRKRRRYQ